MNGPGIGHAGHLDVVDRLLSFILADVGEVGRQSRIDETEVFANLIHEIRLK